MFELSVAGWDDTQRETLSFWLQHAGIRATWGSDVVSVPNEAEAEVLRFVSVLTRDPPQEDSDAAWSDWNQLEPIELDADLLRTASPGLRLAGFLVDVLLLGVLTSLLMPFPDAPSTWLPVVINACYTIGLVAVVGQTVGNMAMRTRVERMHHQGPPGFIPSFVRWLVPAGPLIVLSLASIAAPVELVWLAVVYGPVLIGPSHRGLHDRAAGVFVTDDRS